MRLQLPKITTIGGGTGSFTLLPELQHIASDITAIVTMSDDGGSTGRLRNELDVLPPGDLRQCLTALSNQPAIAELFNYRFEAGELAGHSVGNLIIAALEKLHPDNYEAGLGLAGSILGIHGRVVPITLHKNTVVMQDGDREIRGEYTIGHSTISSKEAQIRLEPTAAINPTASEAMLTSDVVIIMPGNLYGSLLPAVAVDGVAGALQSSKAKLIVVSNLVTKPGQSDGWHVVDYVQALERYIGTGRVDAVLYNTKPPVPEILKRYAEAGSHPVGDDRERFSEISAHPVGAELLASNIANQNLHDPLARTLIRHDAKRVASELLKLL